MTPNEAQAALRFLERTTLAPGEIGTFTQVCTSLQAIVASAASQEVSAPHDPGDDPCPQ